MRFTTFSLEIFQELLQITLIFVLFITLSEKSISWFPWCTIKYILQESHNFNFSCLHMEPESDLSFKIISSLANLYSRTNIEFKFLQN